MIVTFKNVLQAVLSLVWFDYWQICQKL